MVLHRSTTVSRSQNIGSMSHIERELMKMILKEMTLKDGNRYLVLITQCQRLSPPFLAIKVSYTYVGTTDTLITVRPRIVMF